MPSKLEWSKVNLSITTKQRDEKIILNDLAGIVYGGQLLAIMGPTGCGKTSLMNALSGRITYNKNINLHGNIYYNSEFINFRETRKVTGYVGQDETTFPFLTVYETIKLSAYFFSSSSVSKEQREEAVNDVIRELGLQNVRDSILGNEMQRGVSGGEYKRVLIGKELIKFPELMFLDEPTSGLDSFQAYSVMDTMRQLANRGRVIVSVIHQPRSSIFLLFDQLLLLSGGRMIFFGPASQALGYFKSLGYSCPEHFNPADYFLDILSIDYKSPEAETESKNRVHFISENWERYRKTEMTELALVEIHTISRRIESQPDEFEQTKSIINWFQDYGVLEWRCFANIYRNYLNIVVRGVTTIFFAVLLALIYRNLGYTQRDIQNRTGLLYFVLINQGFSPLISVLNIFPSEKVIVTREVRAGAYRYSSYYVASVISDFPNLLLTTILYSTVVYWSSGLNPDVGRFFFFILIVYLSTLNATAIGYFVSTISPNVQIANAIGPPVFIILLLYGGFYINSGSLPPGSEWVRYLSLVYWGFQALVLNEFDGETFTCTPSDVGCRTTGEEVINSLAFEGATVGKSVGLLIVLTFGFHLMGFFGLVIARQRYAKIIPDESEIETEGSKEHENVRVEGKELEMTRLGYVI